MRITALARGGLAVFGGYYDPHLDEAVVPVRDGETASVEIAYPSAPTAMSVRASGLTASTPSISGNDASLAITGINDGGYADVAATVDGAIRKVRVRAESENSVDRYGCGEERV